MIVKTRIELTPAGEDWIETDQDEDGVRLRVHIKDTLYMSRSLTRRQTALLTQGLSSALAHHLLVGKE